jgi:hypothetical protein
MKQIILNLKAIRVVAFGALCATLLSFAVMPGGEGFEIYLNNRLLVQRFGSNIDKVQSLQLEPAQANDQLTIKYHHCGRVGKNRSIAIKNAQNKIIKQWNFADGNDASNAMSCKVKDLLDLGKTSTTLNLYYSSSELPAGRLLTSIKTSKTISASLHSK